VDLRVRLGPLELPNPVVAASGTFGHADEVARLCPPERLGAVTAKSQAPFAWPGNPAPRLHMTTGGMINAVGLQGHGVEHWIDADLPALRALGARVIASVWGHDVDDFGLAAKSLRRAAGDIVAVEVNVSCPNLHASSGASRTTIFAHDPAMTEAAVRAVVDAELGLPVFVKLSPNVTDLPEIAAAALAAGATGLTLVNTVRGLAVDAEARRATLGAGLSGGGLSGAAIKPIALRAVHDVAQAHPGVPIIGTGGVFSGVDAVEMLLAGAWAVGVGTATFLDPRATLRVIAELVDWCAAHGVARVADLTGALPAPPTPTPTPTDETREEPE
jgi:dihydroorotate dehydrogenase (NAD+) catalytic subunit